MTLTQILHTMKTVAVAFTVAALGACSDNAGELQEPALDIDNALATSRPGRTFEAGFYLVVGELPSRQAPASRTPQGDYAPGEGIENYIDLDNDNMRVFLYSTSDLFMDEITELTINLVEDRETSKVYFIKGRTKADISSGKFKVLIVANWPEYPESKTPSLDDFFNVTFSFDGSQPSLDRPIPMFGIKEINLPSVSESEPANLGRIHIIRALAKIEVIFDAPSSGWTITDLKLTNYNTSGFCAPAVRTQDEYVKDSWDRDYVGRPFVPVATGRASDLDFLKVDENRYLLYVPEYDNTTSANPVARISAKVKNAGMDWSEHIIDLKNGSAKTDIMRSIWYKVTIKKINETTDIDVSVDVIPYAVRELEPIFGL